MEVRIHNAAGKDIDVTVSNTSNGGTVAVSNTSNGGTVAVSYTSNAWRYRWAKKSVFAGNLKQWGGWMSTT